MVNVPELLNKILNNNKIIINQTNGGAYSLGYTFLLNQTKIFLKLIFINDSQEDDIIYYNLNKKIYYVSHNYFVNEVKSQKYVYKKTKLAPILIDSCLLDYEKNMNDEQEDILYFFNKLSEKDNKKNVNYKILLNNLKTNKDNKIGLIFMSYMDCINGNHYFNVYLSKINKFGQYFLVKDFIEEIKEEKIRTVYLFILIQLVHNIILLFKNGIIHKDLHFGNLMINNNEITTNQAYFDNKKINYLYVGKVYIIDYGYVSLENKIEKYKSTYVSKKKEMNENFDDIHVEENKHIIELIGQKIINDGYYNEKKKFEDGWFIYDWLLNLLFDSNNNINEEVFEHFNNLLINYEKGQDDFINYKKKEEENCCWLYSLFV